MATVIFGQDLLFWIAVILTVVYLFDLFTCWWANHWANKLGIRLPFKNLTKYHMYTRFLLFAAIIMHIIIHVLFQVYGIVF